MPGPWTWDDVQHRYRSTSTGRFMGADDMLALRDRFVEAQRIAARAISQRLIDGQATTAQWLTDFRTMIRTSYIDQYTMARGGRGMMTQRDWGRIGQMVRDQYRYAQGFAQEIADGKLSEAQILARSEMYPNASTEAYEKGHAEALGIPPLSQYPGDGQTSCLCITTPTSRVLTVHGWTPLQEVPIGELVMTHMGRWRRVTHRVVKRSQPEHRQAWVRAPSGAWVGATDTHLWLTPDGWHNATDICNSACSEYPLAIICKGVRDGYSILQAVREAIVEPQQSDRMQAVPGDMRMRPAQGLSSTGMPQLRECAHGYGAMANPVDTYQDAIGDRCCTGAAAHDIRLSDMGDGLAGQSRWADVDMDLGRATQAHDLPLSVGVAESARANPGWDGGPSSQQGYDRRPARELGAFASAGAQGATCARPRESLPDAEVCPLREGVQSLPAPRASADQVLLGAMLSRCAEDQSGEDGLPNLREGSRCLPVWPKEEATEVLLAGMLPQGTALWDLAVAEDHSFIIEGLVSHNSNCLCHLEYEETDGGWDIFWRLGVTDAHCTGCLDMAADWNPLHVEGQSAKSIKWDPDQPRDEAGRFGSGGGNDSKIADRRQQLRGQSQEIANFLADVENQTDVNLRDVRRDLASAAGISEDLLGESAEGLPEQPIYINVATPMRFLEDNLEQGGLPAYGHLEQKPTHGRQKDYAEMRQKAENDMGVDGMNPIYGYASRGRAGFINSAYGDVIVQMPLQAVKEHISITPNDSFVDRRKMGARAIDNVLRYEEAGIKLQYPGSRPIDELFRAKGRMTAYTEAQLFANDKGRFPFPEGTVVRLPENAPKRTRAAVTSAGLDYTYRGKTYAKGG